MMKTENTVVKLGEGIYAELITRLCVDEKDTYSNLYIIHDVGHGIYQRLYLGSNELNSLRDLLQKIF